MTQSTQTRHDFEAKSDELVRHYGALLDSMSPVQLKHHLSWLITSMGIQAEKGSDEPNDLRQRIVYLFAAVIENVAKKTHAKFGPNRETVLRMEEIISHAQTIKELTT